MATSNVHVGLRPVRVGFLVRADSLEDVLEAARLNTLVWGGIRNLIIPVADVEAGHELVKVARVDLLHPLADAPEVNEVIESFPELRPPGQLRTGQLFAPVERTDELGLLDVRVMASHYWESLIRVRGDTNQILLPTWSADDPLRHLHAVCFGEFGSERPAPRFLRGYKALGADEVEVTETVPLTLGEGVTPITFTGDQLSRFAGHVTGDGLILGNPTDPADLIDFWNLRASGAAVAFLPEDEPEPYLDYCLALLERMTVSPGVSYGPHLWSRRDWRDESGEAPVVPERVVAQLTEAEVQPLKGTLNHRRILSEGGVWSVPTRTTLAAVEEEGRRMLFSLPPTPFDRARTDSFWNSFTLTTIESYSEYRWADATLKIPSLPALNDWASQQINPMDGVRLQDGNVGVFTKAGESSLEIRLVTQAEVAEQVLSLAGLSSELSSAGQALKRVIEQMGGLERCRLFRLPGLRALLARSPVALSWRDAVRAIEGEGSFSRYDNLPTASEIFRRLVDRKVFRAFLKAQCDRCKVRDLYRLEDLAAEVVCPRCGSTWAIAPRLEDTRWVYQASGFFAHHREHGAIPTALAMLRFAHDASIGNLSLLPSQTLQGDDIDCEVDFLGLAQRDGNPAIVVGECKGGQEQVTQAEVMTLERVANRIREAAGIECYIAFATTREAFTEDELTFFRGYAERVGDQISLDAGARGHLRPAPILLTWRELRSFWGYPEPWREHLPNRFAHQLVDLAGNSNYLYLGEDGPRSLPEPDDEKLLI